jgi:copper chaperone CopZ
MKKFITVYGMTSENCRKMITAGLEKLEGVRIVNVRLPNRLVEVEYDEKIIMLDQLKKCIREFGYDPI